nr:endolytic transglycosylase MltG [Streptomyces clavuligerus]
MFGDPAWAAQQASPGQPYPEQQPVDPYAAQQAAQQQYAAGQPDPYQQQPYGGQPQPGQPYAGQPQDPYTGQQDPYAGQPQDPYAGQGQQQPQQPGPVYGGPEAPVYAEQQYPAPQQQYGEQQYAAGGWDAGRQTALTYDPAQVAYDPAQVAQVAAEPYGGQMPDPYTTPDAYPPPEPPGRRTPAADPAATGAAGPAEDTGASPVDAPSPAADEDGPGDGAPAPARSRRGGDAGGSGRSGRPRKQKKSRNGIACLVVATVLAGGLGVVAYVGYQYWEGRFGAAPDYSGAGTGTVQVEIPQGAVGAEIGRILKRNGVVKSVDAFVAAQSSNPEGGNGIQAGVYTLKKEMSAASALATMLKPESRNALIIPEGRRNVWVYQQIDKRLELDPGTTAKVAQEKAGEMGLPAWATGHSKVKDPLEGFLFPASYPVAKGTEPEKVLKRMVTRAVAEYDRVDLAAEARELGLENPWQLVTVASLVQAEGKTEEDFRKMSEVIYNRLKPDNTETNRKIEFDSAFNYLQGQSEIRIGESEIRNNPDPYNTYYHEGLTPGPIGNPGMEALKAAIDPTDDGWLYFVATDGMNKTEFAKDHDEFLVLKNKFNESGVE